ncbi:MAG TPA: hypothetical protein VH135_09170 [Steroidobacteraceae bacterium]|nr:hypothetical protein [Steroidobacteraceae bacterium]
MCEHPDNWTSLLCWLANDWDDWVARAVLLLLAAVVLSLLVGVLARVLRFFAMDVDDIRRLPRSQRVTPAEQASLAPDEPDAQR